MTRAGRARRLFVRDVATSTLIWAFVPQDGNPTHVSAHLPFLDANGHQLAFTNNGATFGFGAAADTRVFVRDLDSGTTTNVSTGISGDEVDMPTLSADGSKVTLTAGFFFGSAPQTYVRDVASGATVLAGARDGTSSPPRKGSGAAVLNASGACVVFLAASDDIVAGGYGPDLTHVYVHALNADCPTPLATIPPPPEQTPKDTVPPVVSRFTVTNTRVAVAANRTAATAKVKKAKKGTAFRFTLSENAATTIVIARKSGGRREGKRCAAPTHRLRKAKRCTRYATAATLKRSKTKQGANTIAYSGRIGRKALRSGSYRATLTATDPAGNHSRAHSISLTVVRR